MDYRPALRHRTGAGEYVHRLAAALAGCLTASDTLTLFSSSWKDRLSAETVPGVRQVDARVPVSLLNLAWHRLEWPPIEWFAGPVEIAQAMHPLMLPARAAARFVTIHDLYFLDRPDQTSAEIRRDYPALAADHARRAHGVIVPSEYTRRQIETRFGVPPERITVCSPGAPDWLPRAEPETPGPILFVGTVEPRKNVPGLLRAYKALVEIEPAAPPLVIAGRISGHAQALHVNAGPAGSAGIADRVKWLGYVSDEQRLSLYRAASMLVLPSFDEGFGLPVLEAMTLGVPVIAARRGSLPEVVGDAGLLVDPEDDAAIATAMRTVLNDRAERRRLADAGVLRARSYSWPEAARRLYAAYATALATRQPA